MNDRLATVKCSGNVRSIAQIPATFGELSVGLQIREYVAVNEQVKDGNLITGVKQLRNQARAHVPRATGYHDTLELFRHFILSDADSGMPSRRWPQPISMSNTAWQSVKWAISTKPYSFDRTKKLMSPRRRKSFV